MVAVLKPTSDFNKKSWATLFALLNVSFIVRNETIKYLSFIREKVKFWKGDLKKFQVILTYMIIGGL